MEKEHKKNISEIAKIATDFEELVRKMKKKLPYQINLIDELRADENAHSKLFAKLISYTDNGKFPFLELFFTSLGGKFEELNISSPKITQEELRIDVLIADKSGKYAVIIENKIHGARDQNEQINRYIEEVEKNGFIKEQIYVLYLTKEGGFPDEKSFSNKAKAIFEERYQEINYKDDILPFLKDYILPICRVKDTLLVSALQQYIDHLSGLFHKRPIEYKMNEELKEYLIEQFDINNKSTRLDKIVSIKEKEEKLKEGIVNYLKEIREDTFKELFNEWKVKIKDIYPNYKIVSSTDKEFDKGKYLYLGIKFIYQGNEFTCAFGMDNYNSMPHWGLTIRSCKSTEKPPVIKELAKKIIGKNGFVSSPRWYGYKYTKLENVLNEYFGLCESVISQEGVSKV